MANEFSQDHMTREQQSQMSTHSYLIPKPEFSLTLTMLFCFI
jgi:hypothetical protein